MVNWVADEGTHPERAKRVEGPLHTSDEDMCPEATIGKRGMEQRAKAHLVVAANVAAKAATP
jgi:hypothetical protein